MDSKQLTELKPPFPWFGGKRRIADLVWSRLGDVDLYIEPFFGGGAVLLKRPDPHGIEIVNDIDGYLTNAWRAIQKDPDAVAEYVDWPVNEIDIIARHIWLVQNPPDVERLMGDPDYYDAKAAGWWIWGRCSWLGGGWCSGQGPWTSVDGRLVKLGQDLPRGAARGVNRVIPNIGNDGVLRAEYHSIKQKRTNIGDLSTSYQLSYWEDSEGQCQRSRENLRRYMRRLSDRLRLVRVYRGDWKRVLTEGVFRSSCGRPIGIFLDPPYDHKERCKDIYNWDDATLSASVRQWCLEHGDDPRLRIALCGYEGEHEMPATWEKVAWRGNRCMPRGYPTQNSDNRLRERVWFSPHCLKPSSDAPTLFKSDDEDEQEVG